MGSVGPRILSLESVDYFEQVKTSVVEKKRIFISKTSMVRLTGQFLNILSRCKKMGEQKVRLFLKQPSVLFIDVIVNTHICEKKKPCTPSSPPFKIVPLTF